MNQKLKVILIVGEEDDTWLRETESGGVDSLDLNSNLVDGLAAVQTEAMISFCSPGVREVDKGFTSILMSFINTLILH